MGKATDFSLGHDGALTFPQGRDTMVLVLTWAASGVDAISYLGLGHVFTANMTGNAVLLGLACWVPRWERSSWGRKHTQQNGR